MYSAPTEKTLKITQPVKRIVERARPNRLFRDIARGSIAISTGDPRRIGVQGDGPARVTAQDDARDHPCSESQQQSHSLPS